MTKTEKYLAQQDKKQERIQLTLACLMFSVAIGITVMVRKIEDIPPKPNFSGYYEGPWVNKNGDLIGTDGKIIKQGYLKSRVASTTTIRESID